VKIGLFFLLIIIQTLNIQAQNKFELFPYGRNFAHLRANNIEPAVGILYDPASSNLKVDIGNSVDMLKYELGKDKYISIGIDFMGYAYTTSYAGNRLQIDALDGVLGGNISYSEFYGTKISQFRLRIIHNSAHLVDGNYDIQKQEWISQKPIPYTKDFVELAYAYSNLYKKVRYRIYSIVAWAWMVRPKTLKKISGVIGGEFYFNFEKFNLNKSPFNFFMAINYESEGIPEYIANLRFQLGFKIGKIFKKGFVLYYEYFHGSNPFNEYYKQIISRKGIGFVVDF